MTTALSGYSLDKLRRWPDRANVAIGITQWHSANVLAAMKQATNQNLKTIVLSGKDAVSSQGRRLSVIVPAAKHGPHSGVQITIGHILCGIGGKRTLEK